MKKLITNLFFNKVTASAITMEISSRKAREGYPGWGGICLTVP